MPIPELWIVAGPNGAGKTTCVQQEPLSNLIPDIKTLNPDDRTRTKLNRAGYQGFTDAPIELQHRLFLEAADEVESELAAAVAEGVPVCVETVLSTDKYCSLVESVLASGGFVGLIYIALNSPALARERVARRVQQGGHDVPDDKISARWLRSFEKLPWFAVRATAFWVIDNSTSEPGVAPRLIARGIRGRIVELTAAGIFPELQAALDVIPKDSDSP